MHFFSADPSHSVFYFERIAFALLAGFAFIGLLQVIPPSYRKMTIAIFTFLGGAFYVAEFFWPSHYNPLTSALPVFGTLTPVFQAFAVGLGLVNLLAIHLKAIALQRQGWGNSLALIAAFFAMLIWGILNAYSPDAVVVPKVAGLHAPITNGDIWVFLFYGGYTDLDSSMFALIGFFIVSASYRAFRIRSLEASLLMAAAVIVMLGQVTLGTAITNQLPLTGFWANFRIENIGLYLLKQINTPAMRGIYFGIGVGFLATSLRLWLSLERGVYFDTEV